MLRWIIMLGLLTLGGQAAARTDIHIHYVDFLQETTGIEALMEALDRADVQRAAVMGMPVIKQWSVNEPQKPRYYLGDGGSMYYYSATDTVLAEAVQSLSESQRQRLWPMISGFNPTDKNAADHVQRMLELYPGLWKGVGEILTRHDAISALTEGENARADHPALLRVYRLAAQHQLPILLHTNITSPREREPLYIAELEHALEEVPEAKFLWAHAGNSTTIDRYQGKMEFLHGEVERLLAEHDNLWIDLSWSVLEPYLLVDGEPDPEWLQLVRKYPDRFMLGSDVLGKFERIGEILDGFEVFLRELPAEVAEQVRSGNARALFEPDADR